MQNFFEKVVLSFLYKKPKRALLRVEKLLDLGKIGEATDMMFGLFDVMDKHHDDLTKEEVILMEEVQGRVNKIKESSEKICMEGLVAIALHHESEARFWHSKLLRLLEEEQRAPDHHEEKFIKAMGHFTR